MDQNKDDLEAVSVEETSKLDIEIEQDLDGVYTMSMTGENGSSNAQLVVPADQFVQIAAKMFEAAYPAPALVDLVDKYWMK